MKRIIKAYNGNIPCIIPEGNNACVIDIPRGRDVDDKWIYDINAQFIFNNIVSPEYKYIAKSGQSRSFIQGNHLVIKDRTILACICKNGNVLVDNHWMYYYPTEFNRFKKELKENGFNTRGNKCIISVYALHSIITVIPLKPTLADYSEEAQLAISTEFLEQERNRINSGEEINLIIQEEEIMDDVAF